MSNARKLLDLTAEYMEVKNASAADPMYVPAGEFAALNPGWLAPDQAEWELDRIAAEYDAALREFMAS